MKLIFVHVTDMLGGEFPPVNSGGLIEADGFRFRFRFRFRCFRR